MLHFENKSELSSSLLCLVIQRVLCLECSICRCYEQNVGVRHFRFRPLLKTWPNRRSESALVSSRFGADYRGVAWAAERRGRRRTGRRNLALTTLLANVPLNTPISLNLRLIIRQGRHALRPNLYAFRHRHRKAAVRRRRRHPFYQ